MQSTVLINGTLIPCFSSLVCGFVIRYECRGAVHATVTCELMRGHMQSKRAGPDTSFNGADTRTVHIYGKLYKRNTKVAGLWDGYLGKMEGRDKESSGTREPKGIFGFK